MEEQQKQSLRNALNYCIENFKKEQAVERIVEYIDDSLKLKEIEFKLDNEFLEDEEISKIAFDKHGLQEPDEEHSYFILGYKEALGKTNSIKPYYCLDENIKGSAYKCDKQCDSCSKRNS